MPLQINFYNNILLVRPAGERLLEIVNIAEIDNKAVIDVRKITYGDVELEKLVSTAIKQGELAILHQEFTYYH